MHIIRCITISSWFFVHHCETIKIRTLDFKFETLAIIPQIEEGKGEQSFLIGQGKFFQEPDTDPRVGTVSKLGFCTF